MAREKKHERTPGLSFVRIGGLIVNLDHLAAVAYPIAGGGPYTLTLSNGINMQISGADADTLLEALGAHCDTTSPEPPK